MQTDLTPDQRQFADSPQGRSQIACARSHYETSQRSRGDRAQPWTPAMEAEAARRLSLSHRWGDN